MTGPNLIVVCDLKFSLGRSKAWGLNARVDPLVDFFLKNIWNGILIDSNLIKVTPTWRKNRVGEARITKRLDHFLLSDDFSSWAAGFRQWVGLGGESDHYPILMELDCPNKNPSSPFKFNVGWL